MDRGLKLLTSYFQTSYFPSPLFCMASAMPAQVAIQRVEQMSSEQVSF